MSLNYWMCSHRHHKIVMNVTTLALSPIICPSSACVPCSSHENVTSFESWTLGKEFVSCFWLWDCSLSLMQPQRESGVTSSLAGSFTTPHGLSSHLGHDMFNRVHICFLTQWVVIPLLRFASFLLHKTAQFASHREALDTFRVKKKKKKRFLIW